MAKSQARPAVQQLWVALACAYFLHLHPLGQAGSVCEGWEDRGSSSRSRCQNQSPSQSWLAWKVGKEPYTDVPATDVSWALCCRGREAG